MLKILLISLIPIITYNSQSIPDKRYESIHFVIFHGEISDREILSRIGEQLDADFRYFREYFNLRPAQRPTVYIYDNYAAFLQYSNSRRWDHGTVSAEIIHLPPPEYIRRNANLSSALTQQIVRLILYSRKLNGCPAWLYEGAAAYYAGISEVPIDPVIRSVQNFTDLEEHLTYIESPNAFRDIIYLASITYEILLKRYGEVNMVTLLRLFNGDYTLDNAIPYALGTSAQTVETRWRNEIIKLLQESGAALE